jgi:Family of unknown function (DUF5906)
MPTFSEGFDDKFRAARERVSSRRHHNKTNGKNQSGVDAESEIFISPDATIGVSLKDFHAYMPMHSYIFTPSGELWPASSVDSRLPRQALVKPDGSPLRNQEGKLITAKASRWLDRNKPVEQMTWAPGEPQIIEGRLISEGGWIERSGCRCFNLYRPATIVRGNPNDAGPWIEHVHRIYGADALHITRYLAHRVQKPHEKINHALVLGGSQGIGKDTILEPVKAAIGPWNFIEATPQQVLGRFNGFVKSVILRISEAHDLGDIDRFKFYDHMKVYLAAPPDVLRVDEKNLREHSVLNVCGVIITTNYKSDGIYLPADDRRHFVAWTNLTEKDFVKDYWSRHWSWYANGGIRHVSAYLQDFDIANFDPKAPPPKTAAWHDIVAASCAPEDAELADALDRAGNPVVTTLAEVIANALQGFAEFLQDRRNSRKIPHRFEACGYAPFRNSYAKDGLWKIHDRRQAIYTRVELSAKGQREAVREKYGL